MQYGRDRNHSPSQSEEPVLETPVQCCDNIQPHGVMVVFAEDDGQILQVSENTEEMLGIPPEDLLEQLLSQWLSTEQTEAIEAALPHMAAPPQWRWTFPGDLQTQAYAVRLHRSPDGFLVLELDPSAPQDVGSLVSDSNRLRSHLVQLQQTPDLESLCQSAVDAVRQISGFDRVMAYRFNADGHGEVVAEAKRDDLDPYLGLHYPDADTRPCRHLFRSSYLRAIPNARATNVPLVPPQNPRTGASLDCTHSLLRGVVPCHQTYLANMGVQSTLVMSLLKDQSLWGLISCHHQTPRHLSTSLQERCGFLAHATSLELSVKTQASEYSDRTAFQQRLNQLLEAMSATQDWVRGATDNAAVLLDLVQASGAAIYRDGACELLGNTPSQVQVQRLVKLIEPQFEDRVLAYDRLAEIDEAADCYREVGSGLLAVAISVSLRHYLLWFRPEYLQTVRWAGDPRESFCQASLAQETPRLSPRGSFDEWRELVCGQSKPWKSWEVQGALALREAILKVVMRQADELAKLTRELRRSNAELEKFAYVASHDLQEPLNLVSSYVQLLEMRYGDRLDDDAREFIGFAVEGVTHMQRLINDLLAYSRVGSRGQPFAPTSVMAVVRRVEANLQGRIEQSGTMIEYEELPTVMADEIQLMQVFQNLIGNAIKFRGETPPVVSVGAERRSVDWLFWVRDNGIGLNPQFAQRIFAIFQRLHTRDEYPGTGIGLAICKRIIERHGGQIWVESTPETGATFYFTLPFQPNAEAGLTTEV